MSTTQTRKFGLHPHLLMDVIQRQAGSLSKSCLEAVMNSVDAGATYCRLTIENNKVLIVDDGQGFRSLQEIELWFETFGQPHEESENKTYGSFRMGRGQLLAAGVNCWRTGEFEMIIDIKKDGLDYQLHTDQSHHAGCVIAVYLYDKLLPSDLNECVRELENWVKYCPIPVLINGRQVSKDPATCKWDYITEQAYVKLHPGTGSGLAIYNLGIHVMTVPGWKYGVGGEVVSRQQVRVNFARNDIQSDCPVWRIVKANIDDQAGKELPKKKSLNDGERQRLVDRLLGKSTMWDDFRESRTITAVTGRHYKPWQLQGCQRVTVAAKGNRKGDTIHRQNLAFVIAEETLRRFHVEDAGELLRVLDKSAESYLYSRLTVLDFDELAATISDEHELLLEKDHNIREKIWLDMISETRFCLSVSDSKASYRNLCIGKSGSAIGWTDANTYIAINRSYLAKLSFNATDFGKLASVLLHEMCHCDPDMDEHDHGQEFYEEFHDHAHKIATFAAKMVKFVPSVLKRHGRKITKAQLAEQDQLAKLEKAQEDFAIVTSDERD